MVKRCNKPTGAFDPGVLFSEGPFRSNSRKNRAGGVAYPFRRGLAPKWATKMVKVGPRLLELH